MIYIGLLILVLVIPASMVSSLINERESRKITVVQEITEKWGDSQCITGPFFILPYKLYYQDQDNLLKFNIHHLHLLPEKVDFSDEMEPQVRYRSIYEAVLYVYIDEGFFQKISIFSIRMMDEEFRLV